MLQTPKVVQVPHALNSLQSLQDRGDKKGETQTTMSMETDVTPSTKGRSPWSLAW